MTERASAADIVTTRNVIGRAIYRLGATLCGVAGWWDAGTDDYERRRQMSEPAAITCARHDPVTVRHARHLAEVYATDPNRPLFLEWAQLVVALADENARLRTELSVPSRRGGKPLDNGS